MTNTLLKIAAGSFLILMGVALGQNPEVLTSTWDEVVLPAAGIEPDIDYSEDIPRCLADDYNLDGLPICYIVRTTDNAVIVLDQNDEVISVAE